MLRYLIKKGSRPCDSDAEGGAIGACRTQVRPNAGGARSVTPLEVPGMARALEGIAQIQKTVLKFIGNY